MPTFRVCRLAVLSFAGTAFAIAFAQSAFAQNKIDFQREIRPILSDNCFQCHGPDGKTRMAGLRLDQKDAALEVRKNGTPIVPGKSSESLLFQRISESNAARRMPPETSHKSLTAAQITRLKQWIDAGAPWKEHWAYQSPVKPPLPAVRNAAWVKNPIDRFILARLEKEGIGPAAAADKRTLVRRVALDVTGLPPTPAEAEAFLKDASPAAYEHMVDRYLASPRYGEHRARFWLDAARYGDTHGIHVDNYREIWPYRDWVINAFNRNQPYDRFSTEQLAGDLLPDATLDQRIATGFIRCGVSTNEAGIIEDEYAEIYAKDRAETVSAVWMGMTVGCATCHDHKFDPISQKDFYGLGAFFRNSTQAVMDGNIPDTPPVVLVPRDEDRQNWTAVNMRLKEIRASMEHARVSAAGPFAQWLEKRRPEVEAHPFLEKEELFRLEPALLRTEAVAGTPVKESPKLDAEEPFAVSAAFFYPKGDATVTIASQQDSKDKGRGWVIDAGGRVIGMRLYGDGGKNIEIRAGHSIQLVPGTWNSVVFSYDGSRKQSGMDLFLNGKAVPTQGKGNQVTELSGSIKVSEPLLLGKNMQGGTISDFRIFKRTLNESEARFLSEWTGIDAALKKPSSGLSEPEKQALLTYYLFRQYEPYQKLAAEQNVANVQAKEIASRGAVTLVMEERKDQTPFAHVLYRGAYDQKRDRVDARTPSVLPPMTADMPKNRLGFAQWLFREENPLTARVAVNRMWQEIFGTGLVKTADDFGSQGEPPTHPELLDWMAVDFRESGWDVKRFYKQLLTSAAYQQAAVSTPVKLEKDPENRLLSRGPRYRLDGETLRDYALSVSGLLAPQIGGPSVKPYQPEGVWEAVAMEGSNTRHYRRDAGDAIYRRSLYTFWKRSAPPASMEIFNAPTRETCTVRRERTNTPLQALVTMNDAQFVEAAKVLAGTALQNVVTFDERLDFVTNRLLTRTLTPEERSIARKAYTGYQSYYDSHPADAKKLLSDGERKPDPGLPQVQYAAMTMLTSQLLNLDEVLNK